MKSLCLVVPKKQGEKVRKRLQQLGILRTSLKIGRNAKNLYLPVTRMVDIGYKVKEREVKELGKRPGSYRDIVQMPDDLKGLLPSSFDIIGSVAVIKIPFPLENYAGEIGKALLEWNRSLKSVAADKGVEGKHRVRQLVVIAGDSDLKTVHKEFGVSLVVDPSKVYFSPRLASERWRVAEKVEEGEVVVDMFSGVGPYSVLIAKRRKPRRVYAIDENPSAIEFLKMNIELNYLDNVVPLMGDAREVLKGIERPDKVIMDLPTSSPEFFEDVLGAVKDGGVVHYYEILETARLEDRVRELEAQAKKLNRGIKIEEKRIVRDYSPTQKHFALDIRVGPA